LATLVIAIIVVMSSSRREWLRILSIVVGLAAGYVVAGLAGKVSFADLQALPWFAAPTPFHYGLGFRATALLPFAFLYLMSAIESLGDITATSLLTGEPIEGPRYFVRLRGGVLADGVSSMLAAVLNSFPSTTFAQNNGVIQLTGIGSRHVGLFVGVMLIVLGLFPVVGGVVQAMPAAVLGGATIIMFGTVAVAGVRILATIRSRRYLRARNQRCAAALVEGYVFLGYRHRRIVRPVSQQRAARKAAVMAAIPFTGRVHFSSAGG
jgi:xanthine permease XanP